MTEHTAPINSSSRVMSNIIRKAESGDVIMCSSKEQQKMGIRNHVRLCIEKNLYFVTEGMIKPTDYRVCHDISYVTHPMVQAVHTPEECLAFREWHNGQTGMLADNGDMAIYSWDYERWVNQGRKVAQNAADWD